MLGIFTTLFRRRQGSLFRVLPIEGPLPEQFLLVQPRHQFVHDGLQGGVRSGKKKTEKQTNILDWAKAITGSVCGVGGSKLDHLMLVDHYLSSIRAIECIRGWGRSEINLSQHHTQRICRAPLASQTRSSIYRARRGSATDHLQAREK